VKPLHRADFLLTAAAASCALFAPGLPAHADERAASVRRAIDAIQGQVGVYARTMGNGPPVFAYNSDATLDTPVAIHGPDLAVGTDVFVDAIPGSRYPLITLIKAMIRQSDNAASNALITYFGFSEINAVAQSAGMESTHLRRHFLDYAAIVAHNENTTTPHDIGTLLYRIERGSREGIRTVASPADCRHMIDIMLGQEDRTKIPAGLPPGIPIANKTGEITGVRNDGAIVDPFGDSPYVLVVLTNNLADEGDGTAGIRRIATRINQLIAG
jgi:beta-lactamase class A